MLAFFRKYERYFFAVITVIIVISFSFFGTYSAMQKNEYVDKVAFTAIDGTEVHRHDLEEMAIFLGTDNEDKLLFGGAWDPNFLNDGVIKNDFLETHMADILVQPYLKDFSVDLEARLQKEKRFTPYVNPYSTFISAKNAWGIVAPDIIRHLETLKNVEDPASKEAFIARVNLYLAERRFPSIALRYVLRNQQQQSQWITPDPNLERTDLSMFGYHTVNDWFGNRFVRLISEFIMNSAIIAKQQGYTVSKEEALADLLRNAEISFRQNEGNPNLGVANVQGYFDEQLRRMRMDQNKATKIWQQVMLFRRLFKDMGNSALVDPFTVRQIHDYGNETVEGDLYRLPEGLRIGDYRTLQKFEVYLAAIGNLQHSELDLPEKFKPIAEIAKNHPEMAERRYLLNIAQIDKRSLQAKVGVRESWDWEVQDKNWELLKKQFPELGIKKGATVEERNGSLDELDNKTRGRIDSFARSQIVDSHPEWIEEALASAVPQHRVVGIRQKGENSIFPGLKDPQKLTGLLDKYPESQEALQNYTTDGEHYFMISVIDRSSGLEILTFAEANRDGTLDKMLDGVLESHYQKIRDKNATVYKTPGGGWKPFDQVRSEVANDYFSPILTQIKQYYSAVIAPTEKPKEMIGDYAATLRLYAYMRGMREIFKRNPDEIAAMVQTAVETAKEGQLPPRLSLTDQWKPVKSDYHVDRGSKEIEIDRQEAFTMSPDQWSNVHAKPNGDLAFFQLHKKYQGGDQQGLYEKVLQTYQLLSADAQRVLMRRLVSEMEQKQALSLRYMQVEETEQPEEAEEG